MEAVADIQSRHDIPLFYYGTETNDNAGSVKMSKGIQEENTELPNRESQEGGFRRLAPRKLI